MTDQAHRDPMQDFADRIVAELEKGEKPWIRPWDRKRPEARKRRSIP
jgi:antirestriction protein ArdC